MQTAHAEVAKETKRRDSPAGVARGGRRLCVVSDRRVIEARVGEERVHLGHLTWRFSDFLVWFLD